MCGAKKIQKHAVRRVRKNKKCKFSIRIKEATGRDCAATL
jgi:hypothetical protein